jgi:hypothetical protein
MCVNFYEETLRLTRSSPWKSFSNMRGEGKTKPEKKNAAKKRKEIKQGGYWTTMGRYEPKKREKANELQIRKRENK